MEYARCQARSCLVGGYSDGCEWLARLFRALISFFGEDPDSLVAETSYGGPITAIVAQDNIAGSQFHPEKSQRLGLAFIANFLRWKP